MFLYFTEGLSLLPLHYFFLGNKRNYICHIKENNCLDVCCPDYMMILIESEILCCPWICLYMWLKWKNLKRKRKCLSVSFSSFFNPSILGCRVKWYCLNRTHVFSVAVLVFETFKSNQIAHGYFNTFRGFHVTTSFSNWTSDFVMIFWAVINLNFIAKKHTPEHTLVVATIFSSLTFCCTCFHLFKQLKRLLSIFCLALC